MSLWPFALIVIAIGVIDYRKATKKYGDTEHVSYDWLNEQEKRSLRNQFEGVRWNWPVEKERKSA